MTFLNKKKFHNEMNFIIFSVSSRVYILFLADSVWWMKCIKSEQKPKLKKKWDGSKIIRVVCDFVLVFIRNKYTGINLTVAHSLVWMRRNRRLRKRCWDVAFCMPKERKTSRTMKILLNIRIIVYNKAEFFLFYSLKHSHIPVWPTAQPCQSPHQFFIIEF